MGSILNALDREWAELSASPRARQALVRWAQRHSTLADFAGLPDVVASRHDPSRANSVQRALAVEAATGDEVAIRTLLKALTPGLVTVAVRRGRRDDTAIDTIMGMGWERIRTYPCHRPGPVAANVVRDVEKWYLVSRDCEVSTSSGMDGDLVDDDHSTEDHVLGRLILRELAAAQRRGTVTNATLAIILRTRVGSESIAEIADEQGTTKRLLRQRRWRAETRLRRLPVAA